MGVSIGTNVGNLSAANAVNAYAQRGQPRIAEPKSRTDANNNSPFFSNDTSEPDKVGFGAGTVSVPGVAVRTIGRSREDSSRIVETLQEAQSRVRERSAANATEQAPEEDVQAPPPQLDLRAAGITAAEGARSFINGLSEAAGRAQSRIEGTPPPQTGPQLNIQVGDETIPLRKQTIQPSFDVYA
ncbi:MAG: hypothetical protein WC655_28065 [Candidatus Hydrogenedentales bacterium]|jgi:hypothetical protein